MKCPDTKRVPTAPLVLTALLSALLANPSHAQDKRPQDVRVLAANCANCHGTNGNNQTFYRLAGQSKTYLVDQMVAFRDGKRQATIMHQLAKGYTDEQINLLAEYFSRQKGN